MDERQPPQSRLSTIHRRVSGIVQRVMDWFPERQIYIRGEGRVQFYTVGRGLQMTIAGLASIFLMWVAFSSVTVVFKDRIIAAEEHRFQRAQDAFEAQIAALQISYDELVAKAASAQAYADGQLSMLGHRQQALQGQTTVLRGRQAPQQANAARGAEGSARNGNGRHALLGKALHWLGLGHQRPTPSFHHPSLDRLAADTAAMAAMARQGARPGARKRSPAGAGLRPGGLRPLSQKSGSDSTRRYAGARRRALTLFVQFPLGEGVVGDPAYSKRALSARNPSRGVSPIFRGLFVEGFCLRKIGRYPSHTLRVRALTGPSAAGGRPSKRPPAPPRSRQGCARARPE